MITRINKAQTKMVARVVHCETVLKLQAEWSSRELAGEACDDLVNPKSERAGPQLSFFGFTRF